MVSGATWTQADIGAGMDSYDSDCPVSSRLSFILCKLRALRDGEEDTGDVWIGRMGQNRG